MSKWRSSEGEIEEEDRETIFSTKEVKIKGLVQILQLKNTSKY